MDTRTGEIRSLDDVRRLPAAEREYFKPVPRRQRGPALRRLEGRETAADTESLAVLQTRLDRKRREAKKRRRKVADASRRRNRHG